MKRILFIAGLLLLLAVEILRVYFIMPFPGSQYRDTIDIAYWLNNNIIWLRILGILLVAYSGVILYRKERSWKKYLVLAGLALYAVVFYLFNFRFLAEKMFLQPGVKTFAGGGVAVGVAAGGNSIPLDKLVIGLDLNREARAYPIQLIGYHHQVVDTVGGFPVMVTYCTVCRTGRVFSPVVKGKTETFRLVGMDHFNAMFEDATTGSWWQQSTGTAITGPLKGTRLQEYPSRQMSLAAWLRLYPESRILQPDSNFREQYEQLNKYDKGTGKGALTRRDSTSWQFKSWVLGVSTATASRAYDWNELVAKRLIQDSLPGLPLVILLEKDSVSYHAWNRELDGKFLQFVREGKDFVRLRDLQTNSAWSLDGFCVDGDLKGRQLKPVQAYQEFWHSWQSFHPNTTKFP